MDKGELIISYSKSQYDLLPGHGSKRVIFITKNYTKFKINVDKCHSYLNIHLPNLQLSQEILERCVYIFKLVLKYGTGIENLYDDAFSIYSECSAWNPSRYSKFRIFYTLFNNDPLIILCANPNDEGHLEKEYQLIDILTDNSKFEICNNYWSKKYSYIDLFDIIKNVSNIILQRSEYYKYGIEQVLPDEIVELILYFAINSYHGL